MKQFLRTWTYSIPAGVAVMAVFGWLVFGFFGFHLLFLDDEVDEALPVFGVTAAETAAVTDLSDAVTPTVPAITTTPPVVAAPVVTEPVVTEPVVTEPVVTEPVVTEPVVTVPVVTEPVVVTEATGSFVSLDHETSGDVLVLGDGTGERFLRFEDLATDNGPDLEVYLVNSSAGGAGDAGNVVSLGKLTGNIGDQNYVIPVGTDLSTYDTVVIWCVRFSSPFGEATLVPT